MHTKNSRVTSKKHLKTKIFGKKIKSEKLSIKEDSTEFFEDIPLYRGNNVKPVRRLGKIHLSRSRRPKSTKP